MLDEWSLDQSLDDSLVGGHWRLLPERPDHSEAIRKALLDGYATAAPGRVPERAN